YIAKLPTENNPSQRPALCVTANSSRQVTPPPSRRRTDLLSNYLSQRFIDPVLPTRTSVLKVIKNVPVNSQRDKLLCIRDGRTLGRQFCGLRGSSATSREVVVLRVLWAAF